MTLKLIDKNLRSKYAEALFKNEASYEKEIESRFKRLNLDHFRNSQVIDAGSQFFLNKVRQKRSKWTQDDLRFRDYYRLVCRKVHNKKLEGLKQIFDYETKQYQNKKLDPKIQIKFEILQQQLKMKEMNTTLLYNTEFNISSVPKLPDILTKNDDTIQNIYNRYSKSDRNFIEKFPAKVELTLTDVGKQYILNEKQKNLTLKRQKIKYAKIQENAISDLRYKNLINFLEE